MKILVDRNSAQAVYLQIRDRLSRLIESGALQPGDRLPSIRSLAKTTRVNKLTVIEAYNVEQLINVTTPTPTEYSMV